MAAAHIFRTVIVTATLSGTCALTPLRPAAAQEATRPAFGGVYTGDGIRLELKPADGGALEGTLTVEGEAYPVTARAEGAQFVGSFTAAGERFQFRGTLAGDVLTVMSDGETYRLTRMAAKPSNPLAKAKAGADDAWKDTTVGNGWKLLKHPLGLQIQYPPDWKLQELEEGYRLDTGDMEEVVLVGGFPAQGIQDPKDPRVAAAADQLVAAQLGGLFQRQGAPSPAKDGSGRGITLLYTGEVQGRKFEARMWITVLKDSLLGVTGLMPAPKLAQRRPTLEKVFASLKEFRVELDRRLTGTWRKFSETVLDAQSPGGRRAGDASLTSNRNIAATLGEDGRVTFRVTGKGIATGAGQALEYDIDDTHRGAWSATDGKLLLLWEDGTTDEYTYALSGPRLLLRGNGREYVYQKG